MFLNSKFSRISAGVLAAGVVTALLTSCAAASTVASELEKRGFTDVTDINDDSSIDTAYVSAGGCRGIASHDNGEGWSYAGANASEDFTVTFAQADGTELIYTNPANVNIVLEDEAMAFCAKALPSDKSTPENS